MKKTHKIFSEGSHTVQSEDEMRTLGRELAALLEPGDVIGLVGDLGAGKTRFVQGVLAGLGASAPAASPTFALVHEHADGAVPVAHFDFYRMSSPDEALSLGWDDYLASGMALLVEWADRFEGSLMPADTIWVHIARASESTRELSIR